MLKSVEIYRSSLPFREIDNLSAAVESNPLLFPCRFQAVFVGVGKPSFDANELSVLIESHMRKLASKDSASCGACSHNAHVSVVLESGPDCVHSDNYLNWKCGALNELNKYDDELFDDYLHSLLDDNASLSHSNSNSGKVYTVVVVRKEEQEDVSAVVGKYRHAWIVGRIPEEEAVKKVSEVFVKAFVNGGKEEGSIGGEFMPVGADGKIVLSFNLLNADPHDWTYDWYGADLMLVC